MDLRLIARIARALDKARIPYMLIGGQAAALRGRPRFTDDVDVSLGLGADRWELVHKIIRQLKMRPAIASDELDAFVRQTLMLPCDDARTGVRIDFAFTLFEFERQAIARARKVLLAGYRVRVASAEDLIVLKVIAGRPVDMQDV